MDMLTKYSKWFVWIPKEHEQCFVELVEQHYDIFMGIIRLDKTPDNISEALTAITKKAPRLRLVKKGGVLRNEHQ